MGVEENSDADEEKEPIRTSIFDFDVDSVEVRKQEILAKYPWASI